MPLLTVDESRCKRDWICVAECPTNIIRLKDGNGYPQTVPGAEGSCLACGHCVAVCPQGALSNARVPLEVCPPVTKELSVDHQRAVQFLRSRRSVRVFEEKEPDREQIRRLIEIARYAPTGSNSQTVEWLVFTDKARVRSLAEAAVQWMRGMQQEGSAAPPYVPLVVGAWNAGYDAVLRNAPALVVATAPEGTGNGMVDLTLALSYLELAAPTLGLGTCWAGLLRRAMRNDSSLREKVGVPPEHPNYYPMMVGYNKFSYHRLPERKPPKITWR